MDSVDGSDSNFVYSPTIMTDPDQANLTTEQIRAYLSADLSSRPSQPAAPWRSCLPWSAAAAPPPRWA
jgi:hypothetical protein